MIEKIKSVVAKAIGFFSNGRRYNSILVCLNTILRNGGSHIEK